MSEKKLNVFFIPFFASGHMIPMADLAALFSKRPNVISTMCLTPANAAFLQPTLHPDVKVLTYPFPSEAAGLPPGVENLSSITPDQEHKIDTAVDLCKPVHKDILHSHSPDAIIADIHFNWTTGIASELGVPRLTWLPIGVFPQVVMNILHKHVEELVGRDETTVKGIPGKEIKIPVSELPESIRKPNFMTQVWEERLKSQPYGMIVNTFYGIEPAYCDHYRKTVCRQAWFVGPVALATGARVDKEKGHESMKWLDAKENESVVFVCFGSWCQFKDEQLKEIAVGLEGSGRPFLWVVRKDEGEWMPDEKWEERVKGRGMVIRGWAPQVRILEHRAVGAFLTHCGWNSVLEAMTGGVPLLTWPLVFEQFINERLVVEVLGAGMRVYDGYRSTRDEEKAVVPASTIAKAVTEFMVEEGKEGRRRMKAKECAEMARAAVVEGGSSWNDLNGLIDGLKEMSGVAVGNENTILFNR